jgi:hypothetical protein
MFFMVYLVDSWGPRLLPPINAPFACTAKQFENGRNEVTGISGLY